MSKSQRGRPPVPFTENPDRYLLGVAAALPDLGTSHRGAVEIAIAAIEGWAVASNPRPRGHGLNMLSEKYAMRSVPGYAASIENRQRELRRKLKKLVNDPSAARWLAAISQAILLALRHTVLADRNRAVDEVIVELAASVGEEAFARSVLINLWRLQGLAVIEAACTDLLPPVA